MLISVNIFEIVSLHQLLAPFESKECDEALSQLLSFNDS